MSEKGTPEGMQARKEVLGTEHVNLAETAEDRSGCRLPGSNYSLCLGRNMDSAWAFAIRAKPADDRADGGIESRRRTPAPSASSKKQWRDGRRDS